MRAREVAAEALGPLWDLTNDQLDALNAIQQHLMHGTPIDLRQSDAEAIIVPLQREYTGLKPVIPSSLADTLCSKLAPELLLLCLNSLMYTTYPMTGTLSAFLHHYIHASGVDFGTLYAHVRPHWAKQDFASFEAKRLQASNDMEECRQSMLLDGIIQNPQIPPRRLWDLHSNRIIDSSLISAHWPGSTTMLPCKPGSYLYCLQPEQTTAIYAVSHSWAPLHERVNKSTTINNQEWRVPLPNDITLDHVRVELLNLGGEYAWLDVLCLRQADDEAPGEAYRAGEWALDVPTIGNVYRDSDHVIHYFSGLGRPFVLGDLSSNRHWLNRAWTLQEIGQEGSQTTAGITESSPADPWKNIGASGPFYDAIASARDIMDGRWSPEKEPQTISSALLSMKARQCENALDRISGLGYAIGCNTLPIYDTTWSEEQAWEALIRGMAEASTIIFSMLFTAPGSGRYQFLPSWKQIMDSSSSDWGSVKRRCMGSDLIFLEWLQLGEDNRYRLMKDTCIVFECRLEWLGGDKTGGTATMPCRSGGSIQRPCVSSVPIGNGTYALLSFVNFHLLGPSWLGDEDETEDVRNLMWIVGHVKDGHFYKEATLELCDMAVPEDWEAVGESAKGLVLM